MPRKKTDRSRRTVLVPNNHWEELCEIAEVRGLTVSDIIREALTEYLKKGEK